MPVRICWNHVGLIMMTQIHKWGRVVVLEEDAYGEEDSEVLKKEGERR